MSVRGRELQEAIRQGLDSIGITQHITNMEWRKVLAPVFAILPVVPPEATSLPHCETTGTPRLPCAMHCGTYPGNLGPCETFEEGSNGRCVYCDHGKQCHRAPAAEPPKCNCEEWGCTGNCPIHSFWARAIAEPQAGTRDEQEDGILWNRHTARAAQPAALQELRDEIIVAVKHWVREDAPAKNIRDAYIAYEQALVHSPTAAPTKGHLIVGLSESGKEVIINHPDIDADKDGVGHIVFSPDEARNLAILLDKKADEAQIIAATQGQQETP